MTFFSLWSFRSYQFGSQLYRLSFEDLSISQIWFRVLERSVECYTAKLGVPQTFAHRCTAAIVSSNCILCPPLALRPPCFHFSSRHSCCLFLLLSTFFALIQCYTRPWKSTRFPDKEMGSCLPRAGNGHNC